MTVHNILNIYGTNAFENGIGIQTAMFNHSCNSNAEAVWVEDSKTSTVRARSNIISGEEITINYISRDLPMKKHLERKEILMSIFFFNCVCKLCKNGKVNDKYDQGMNISCLSIRNHFQQICSAYMPSIYEILLSYCHLLSFRLRLIITRTRFDYAGLICSLQNKT